MPSIGVIAHNAQAHIIAIKLELAENPAIPQEISLYREAMTAYRVLAFAALLERGDVGAFFNHLMNLSTNWLGLLEKYHTDSNAVLVPASCLDGLYCALICGDDGILAKICHLSASRQVPPEYDDEFLLALFLKELILQYLFNEPATSDMSGLLDQIEAYREDDALIVTFLRGLYKQLMGAAEKDSEQLENDFLGWHEEMVDAINTRADSSSAPYSMQVTRYVSLEALALIKLAERLGYHFCDNIQLIPAAARTPPSIDKMAPVDRLQ